MKKFNLTKKAQSASNDTRPQSSGNNNPVANAAIELGLSSKGGGASGAPAAAPSPAAGAGAAPASAPAAAPAQQKGFDREDEFMGRIQKAAILLKNSNIISVDDFDKILYEKDFTSSFALITNMMRKIYNDPITTQEQKNVVQEAWKIVSGTGGGAAPAAAQPSAAAPQAAAEKKDEEDSSKAVNTNKAKENKARKAPPGRKLLASSVKELASEPDTVILLIGSNKPKVVRSRKGLVEVDADPNKPMIGSFYNIVRVMLSEGSDPKNEGWYSSGTVTLQPEGNYNPPQASVPQYIFWGPSVIEDEDENFNGKVGYYIYEFINESPTFFQINEDMMNDFL